MGKHLLAIFLLLAPGAAAQTRLTLADAVATALAKNPTRKAAVFHRQAADAGVQEVRGSMLPQVSFSESYQRSNDPVFVFGSKLRQQRFGPGDFALNVLNTPTPFGNFATRLSAGWQLFDSGASWMRLAQSKQASQLAQRQLERSEQQLVFRVVDAYLNLLLARSSCRWRTTRLARRRRSMSAARAASTRAWWSSPTRWRHRWRWHSAGRSRSRRATR